MISATSLNLSKGHQVSLGVENGRLRMDSQKFLVPSLPVSSRSGSGGGGGQAVGIVGDGGKRRERSIVNGTAHPSPSNDYGSLSHNISVSSSNNYPSHNIIVNGLRPSYNNNHHSHLSPRDLSPNNGSNQYLHHLSSSNNNSNGLRKDAQSQSPMMMIGMYGNGEINNRSPPGHAYPHPHSIPRSMSSSPAQVSSSATSPNNSSSKGSHSHSHSRSPNPTTVVTANYSPKLPPGPPPVLLPPHTGADLPPGARLYPQFPHPPVAMAAHLGPAFYAAAAAAAASSHSHPLTYPLFAHPYNPAAAASVYLDSFHSSLARQVVVSSAEGQQRSRSPSPNRSHHIPYPLSHLSPQQSHSPHHHPHHHLSTSVTSLHNNSLMESGGTERHGYNGGMSHHQNHHQHIPTGQISPQQQLMGISKGGPLGISGGIMNLPSSKLTSSPHSKQHTSSSHPENLTLHSKSGSIVQQQVKHPWSDREQHQQQHHPGFLNPESISKKSIMAESEAGHVGHGRDAKFRVSRSPSRDKGDHSKKPKNISFIDSYSPSTSKKVAIPTHAYHHPPTSSYSHMNSNGHLQNNSHGILTDLNLNLSHAKKQSTLNNVHLPNISLHHQHQQQHLQSHQGQQQQISPPQQFLPPSPKKQSQQTQWSFAVPANPVSKPSDPSPQKPSHPNNNHLRLHHNNPAEQSQYLTTNSNHQNLNLNLNQKPSNHQSNTSLYLHHPSSSGQSAQQQSYASTISSSSLPSSCTSIIRTPGNSPRTPKSPSVKFNFGSGNTKENQSKQGKGPRTDSSSSSSSSEGVMSGLGKSRPVEQMPTLEAFRRGSLIQLASGELRPVENLKAEDFINAASHISSGSLKIIHCTILSIQQEQQGKINQAANNGKSLFKVTMTVGSPSPHFQNQQVVLSSTPEQPFFIVGRGWCSLSPKVTEKMLDLPCSSLAVGDVCITLSKSLTIPTPSQGQGQGQASHLRVQTTVPNKRGRKSGSSGRGIAAATKRLLAQQQSQVVVPPTPAFPKLQDNSSSGPRVTVKSTISTMTSPSLSLSSNSEAIKVPSMGPPLSLTVSTSTATTSTAVVNATPCSTSPLKETLATDETDGPSSPKRRRWSAPEPDFLPHPPSSTSHGDIGVKMNHSENQTPPGSESIITFSSSSASDGKGVGVGIVSPVKTDVNSNVNVKLVNVKDNQETTADNINNIVRKCSPEAQSTKA